MNPPAESPFRRDEPVGRSGPWIWLAAMGMAVMVVISLAQRVAAAENTGGMAGILFSVLLQGGLLWLLVRAAQTTSDCRRTRSFDIMARALRAQQRFWIAGTIFATLTLLPLLAAWWLVRERSERLRSVLEVHSRARQNPVPDGL